jgi:hypothetical protein
LKKQQYASCQKKQNLACSTTLKFLLIFSVGGNPFLNYGIVRGSFRWIVTVCEKLIRSHVYSEQHDANHEIGIELKIL